MLDKLHLGMSYSIVGYEDHELSLNRNTHNTRLCIVRSNKSIAGGL